ncbi:MAG: protein kinase domain-containing protein [Candidatus Pacearchaeota archaeon]
MALDASGSVSSDDLLERVRNIIPSSKYHSLARAHSDGKQRETFTVKQGSGKRERVFRVKVDRPNLEGRLAELSARGYNTAGEIQNLLGIPSDEAIKYHISPLTDFYVDESTGAFVSLEPEFRGATTLREFVDSKGGKLDYGTFNKVFRQVLVAEKAAIQEYGLYHRDLHPSNILVNPETLEVRITDFTNAATVGQTASKATPTSGARFMRDPLLDSRFTGVERAYGEDSEMYGLGVLALQLLTGKSAVSYDFENGTAVDVDGTNLLDENGKIIPWKHDSAFVRPTLDIPSAASGHAYWIRCATGFGTQGPKRFSSIDELIENFDKVSKPSLWERVKKNKTLVGVASAAALFASAGLFGTGWYLDRKDQAEEREVAVEEAKRPEIRPYWNSKGLEISNDLIDLNFYVSSGSYPNHQLFPQRNNLLYLKSGDSVDLIPKAIGNISDRRGGSTTLPLTGRWYIEGYPFADGSISQKFQVLTKSHDEGSSYDGYGGYQGSNSVKLPDLSDGVYSLAVELLAPSVEEIQKAQISNFRDAKVRFAYPGEVISRKRVPLVVGKTSKPIDLHIARAAFADENLSFRDLSEGIDNTFSSYRTPSPDDYKSFVYYPDLGVSREITGKHWFLPAPANFATDRAIAYFAIFDKSGNMTNFSGVPLEKKVLEGPYLNEPNAKPMIYPVLGRIGEDFPEKLVKFRKELPYRKFKDEGR